MINRKTYSEGLETWAMDAADNDEEKAGELLDQLEKDINRLLPGDGYIDMETCEPIGVVIAPEAWEELLQETANRIALEEVVLDNLRLKHWI